jgi:hypothetical protein
MTSIKVVLGRRQSLFMAIQMEGKRGNEGRGDEKQLGKELNKWNKAN